jgi:hypothetical protein
MERNATALRYWRQLIETLRYEPERSRVRSPVVLLEVFIDTILPAALWPGVDSASNKNEYHEYFLEVNAAGA